MRVFSALLVYMFICTTSNLNSVSLVPPGVLQRALCGDVFRGSHCDQHQELLGLEGGRGRRPGAEDFARGLVRGQEHGEEEERAAEGRKGPAQETRYGVWQ